MYHEKHEMFRMIITKKAKKTAVVTSVAPSEILQDSSNPSTEANLRTLAHFPPKKTTMFLVSLSKYSFLSGSQTQDSSLGVIMLVSSGDIPL